jgi:hypothetical protein
MAAARGFRSALFLVGLTVAGTWAAAGLFKEGPLRAYLPAGNAVEGWARDGEPQEYEGEELYTYIDGGAEIYQEYGFRRVIIQDYKNAKGKAVSLEIFEMESPAAAFGMFSFKRSGSGITVALGAGAELEAYYLNFWKGRFLVTLTGFDEAPETIDGLTAVAGIVDSKVREAGEAPDLVSDLPAKGLRTGSVKYLKGLLGLNNIYPFYTARGLAFAEAARGVYENGATLLILDYGSTDVRARAWLDLKSYLAGSDRFKVTDSVSPDVFLVMDGKGQSVAFAESGPRLLIGISPDPSVSLAIVRQSRESRGSPDQVRLLSVTGTKATNGQASPSNGQHLEPIIQLANDTGSGSNGSQFPSDLLLGGIDKLKIELSLDGFGIWPMYFQANSSFSIVYQLEIGTDSHPTNIYLLAGEKFIDAKAAKAGLAKWTFFGLEPKKKCVLVLNWEHNRGYVSMSLFSDQLSLSVRLLKDKTGP